MTRTTQDKIKALVDPYRLHIHKGQGSYCETCDSPIVRLKNDCQDEIEPFCLYCTFASPDSDLVNELLTLAVDEVRPW
jgi:hypothetical protein